MSREFCKRPVLVRTDAKTGLHHKFYVMYHATKKENVSSILTNGFRESTGGMLGPGFYVNRDIDKTRAYGDVCFKLLVYVGSTKEMTEPDRNGTWQSQCHSAYLPPNNDVVASKREETCLKSAKQARILGIAYGFDLSTMDGRVRNLEGTKEFLDQQERKVLDELEEASLGTFILLSPTLAPVAQDVRAQPAPTQALSLSGCCASVMTWICTAPCQALAKLVDYFNAKCFSLANVIVIISVVVLLSPLIFRMSWLKQLSILLVFLRFFALWLRLCLAVFQLFSALCITVDALLSVLCNLWD